MIMNKCKHWKVYAFLIFTPFLWDCPCKELVSKRLCFTDKIYFCLKRTVFVFLINSYKNIICCFFARQEYNLAVFATQRTFSFFLHARTNFYFAFCYTFFFLTEDFCFCFSCAKTKLVFCHTRTLLCFLVARICFFSCTRTKLFFLPTLIWVALEKKLQLFFKTILHYNAFS